MAAKSWDPKNPQLLWSQGGIQPQIDPTGLEEASQTYKAGCVVKLDTTSGEVEEIAAASSGAFTAAGIYGLAMVDASGTASTAAPVQVFKVGDIYKMYITSSGTAALASTLVPGKNYGVYVDANQVTCVDGAVTNQDMVTYLGPIGNDSASYYGKFRFLGSVLQSNVGF